MRPLVCTESCHLKAMDRDKHFCMSTCFWVKGWYFKGFAKFYSLGMIRIRDSRILDPDSNYDIYCYFLRPTYSCLMSVLRSVDRNTTFDNMRYCFRPT